MSWRRFGRQYGVGSAAARYSEYGDNNVALANWLFIKQWQLQCLVIGKEYVWPGEAGEVLHRVSRFIFESMETKT
jgi:hypothetical protein